MRNVIPQTLMGRKVKVSTRDALYTGRISDLDEEALFVEEDGEKYIIPWDTVLFIAENRKEYKDEELRRELRHVKLVYAATCLAIMACGALIGLVVRWLS